MLPAQQPYWATDLSGAAWRRAQASANFNNKDIVSFSNRCVTTFWINKSLVRLPPTGSYDSSGCSSSCWRGESGGERETHDQAWINKSKSGAHNRVGKSRVNTKNVAQEGSISALPLILVLQFVCGNCWNGVPLTFYFRCRFKININLRCRVVAYLTVGDRDSNRVINREIIATTEIPI